VDATYSRFDLGNVSHYQQFLIAHARAVGTAEAWLYGTGSLPPWRSRLPLLAEDLAALGLTMPAARDFDAPQPVRDDEAWRWGVLYVLEGSRLGAAILCGRTPPEAPTAFLGARHLAGEWRALLRAMDDQAGVMGGDWADHAITGACACFELYRRAGELHRR
jgi:heme oxygenase